jgi:hypothetical protein
LRLPGMTFVRAHARMHAMHAHARMHHHIRLAIVFVTYFLP